MTDLTLESLAQRVNRLERQNRRLKAAAITVAAGLAAAVCMGQMKTPDTIEAKQFIARDAQGKMRIKLSLNEGAHGIAQPGLTLYDAEGNGRAGLYVGTDGPAFDLTDGKGWAPRLTLSVGEMGQPELYMRNAKGKPRVHLVAWDVEGLESGLGLYDRTIRQRLLLTLADDGQPSLRLLDGDGKPVFSAP